MNRRQFTRSAALLPASLAHPLLGRWTLLGGQAAESAQELSADVVVVGGGTGGCAAALGAARSGKRVIMTEETDWIGGQLTAQGLSAPDEHPYIEECGRTKSWADYRKLVRDFYRTYYPLNNDARRRVNLNPGDGWVSPLCHEPTVALRVLYQMLAPYLGSGALTIFLNTKAVAAETQGDSVRSVTVQRESGAKQTLHAAYFLDATELGDLLPLTKTEYVIGTESQQQTGEMHAPPKPDPMNIQSFAVCFAIDYLSGEDHRIPRPDEYESWRNYVPSLRPPYPQKLLGLTANSPYDHGERRFSFDPAQDAASSARFVNHVPAKASGGSDPLDSYRYNTAGLVGHVEDLWTYRRLLSKRNCVPGSCTSSVTCVNWPQNDFWAGNIIDVSPEEATRSLKRAKQLSLSLLYWLQTEAPRPDGGTGWPGLRLRADLVGTADGLAKYPYIREARRIRAEFTVTEAHVGVEQLVQTTGKSASEVTAAFFHDSVGVGLSRLDLHPSSGGVNYVDLAALPHEIPLGALIPQRVENLLPAAKNIGTTHITNGCYRLHPGEWNVGESAGILAAFCLDNHASPRQVRQQPKLLIEYQRTIQAYGVEIHWPASIHGVPQAT